METNLHVLAYTAFDSSAKPIVSFLVWLVESYRLPATVRVLDVGCGPGRMLGEFANLGWHVCGLEIDPDFYQQACTIAAKLSKASVRHGGFDAIEQTSTFDLITAINSPFAYLLNRQEQEDALARCYQGLKPGGFLVLDVPNLLWFLKYELSPIVRYTETEGFMIHFIEQHDYDFHNLRYVQTNTYTITPVDGGGVDTIVANHSHRITTPPELIHLLEKSGFDTIRTFTDYHSRQDEPLNGRMMLLVARKPPLC